VKWIYHSKKTLHPNGQLRKDVQEKREKFKNHQENLDASNTD